MEVGDGEDDVVAVLQPQIAAGKKEAVYKEMLDSVKQHQEFAGSETEVGDDGAVCAACQKLRNNLGR